MLALATFFPTADNVGQEGFDLLGVNIKITLLIYIHKFYFFMFIKYETNESITGEI